MDLTEIKQEGEGLLEALAKGLGTSAVEPSPYDGHVDYQILLPILENVEKSEVEGLVESYFGNLGYERREDQAGCMFLRKDSLGVCVLWDSEGQHAKKGTVIRLQYFEV